MTFLTDDKGLALPQAARGSGEQYAQLERQRGETGLQESLDITGVPDAARFRQQIVSRSEMARELWEPRVAELMKIPLLNRGITREGIAQVLPHNLELNSAVMLMQVDPNSVGVPIEILQRLYGQEAANQALGIEKCICIVGHSMAGISQPGVSLAKTSYVTALSFKAMQLPNVLGLKTIEMVLDTDLKETPQYEAAKQMVGSSNQMIPPRVLEEMRLYLTAQMIWDCKVISGWTSFPDKDGFIAATEGRVAQGSFAHNCVMGAFSKLEEIDPTLFALVAFQSGRSMLGTSKPAHPDLILPVTYYGSEASGPLHGQIPLSSFDPAHFLKIMPDVFDQPQHLQKSTVQHQSHYWELVKLIREVQPDRLPAMEQEYADHRVTSEILKSWKIEAEYDPQNQTAARMLMQAVFAAYTARTPIIMQSVQALTGEVSSLYASISPRGTLERIDRPGANSESVGGDSQAERAPRRGTASLNTSFRGISAASAPLLPEDLVLVAAEVGGSDSTDSIPPGDNEEGQTALAE